MHVRGDPKRHKRDDLVFDNMNGISRGTMQDRLHTASNRPSAIPATFKMARILTQTGISAFNVHGEAEYVHKVDSTFGKNSYQLVVINKGRD